MATFIQRAASAALTLWVISVLVFLGMHLVPGGYAQMALPLGSTTAEQQRLSRLYGLDGSLVHQYVSWLRELAHGTMGVSLQSQQPVANILGARWPVTVELALLALLLAMVVGIPLGVLAAVPDVPRGLRAAVGSLGPLGISLPDFVLGSLLLLVFSRYRLGLTVGNYRPLADGLAANLTSIALPVVTIAVGASSIIVRTTRTATLHVLSESYVEAAVARGESIREILWRHGIRNIGVPLITVCGTILGYLFGGAVVAETIFSVPGLGSLLLQAVQTRDYPVVQSTIMLTAGAFVVLSLVVDTSYRLVDPRIRLGRVAGR